MTREEFKAEVEALKDEYIQTAKDYIDALLNEDFKKAAEVSMGIMKVFKPEVLAYIGEKMMALDEYDELIDNYIEDCDKVETLMTE